MANARLPLIDALKAIASQIILIHHLVSYGPLAAARRALAPDLTLWLFEYGRMAVQVFLVVAGFLAARGLSPEGQPLARSPWPLIGQRYRRLVIPFLAALGVAVLCAGLARPWLQDDMLPAAPTLLQGLAHATLLHGITGVDALSAGVWYIAIDFQLFSLFVLLAWLARHTLPLPWLVGGLCLGSLIVFNRDPELDNWAIYFFGAYGLGALAAWASRKPQAERWLTALALLVAAALLLDFRLRILLALLTALLLGLSARQGWLTRWPDSRVLGKLGEISYSVFLIHFSILMLANALVAQFVGMTPPMTLIAIAAAWLASLAAGLLLHRWVEAPLAGHRQKQ